MFDTSGDILNIVKAFSILSISMFISWAIYYFARIMKELFRITKGAGEILTKVEELINTIKEKVDHSTSYLLLMSEGVKKLVDVIGKYTSNKESDEKREDN